MERKSDASNVNKSGRKRELNIIFFVDASKTRSLRISLTLVRSLLIVVGLAICWSGVSSWWLYQTKQKNYMLDNKMAEQLAVIFEYQTRFDGVYEDAYPRFDASVYEKALAKLEPATDDELQEDSEARSDNARNGLAAKSPVNRSVSESTSIGVTIDEPKFSREGNRLSLTFSIRNTNSPARAVGYVYGVAKFVAADGEVIYLVSPDNLSVDRHGKLNSPRHETHRFSIRYFRGKTFQFPSPPNKEGRFSEVKVYLSRANGGETSYTLAVDKQYGASDASSEPARTQRSRG